MATVKATLRYYKKEDGKKAIYIRVSHLGFNCYKPIGISIPPSVWKDGEVSKSYSGWAKINEQISREKNLYMRRVAELESSNREYTVDDIMKMNTLQQSSSFLQFGRQ